MSVELRCLACGHSSGYHGEGFCTLRLGTDSDRPQCDCKKWVDPRSALSKEPTNEQ